MPLVVGARRFKASAAVPNFAIVQVTADIVSVCALKDPSFNVRDVPVLADLMETHVGGQSVNIKLASDKLRADQVQLEKSQFDLLMNQMEYDCQSWRVYKSKLGSHAKAVYGQKLTWKSKQHDNAMEAGTAFMSSNTCVFPYARGKNEEVYQKLQDFQKDIGNRLQLDPSQVVLPR